MNSKDILVFVNGKLLFDSEYDFKYLTHDYIYKLHIITFKTSLNSASQNTFTDIIIIENGIRIYEQKIKQQNITTINLYSGEISE